MLESEGEDYYFRRVMKRTRPSPPGSEQSLEVAIEERCGLDVECPPTKMRSPLESDSKEGNGGRDANAQAPSRGRGRAFRGLFHSQQNQHDNSGNSGANFRGRGGFRFGRGRPFVAPNLGPPQPIMERVAKNVMHINYDQKMRQWKVTRKATKFMETFGVPGPHGSHYLFHEEVACLFEMGAGIAFENGRQLALCDIFAKMEIDRIPWIKYVAYRYLRKCGFIVVRHRKPTDALPSASSAMSSECKVSSSLSTSTDEVSSSESATVTPSTSDDSAFGSLEAGTGTVVVDLTIDATQTKDGEERAEADKQDEEPIADVIELEEIDEPELLEDAGESSTSTEEQGGVEEKAKESKNTQRAPRFSKDLLDALPTLVNGKLRMKMLGAQPENNPLGIPLQLPEELSEAVLHISTREELMRKDKRLLSRTFIPPYWPDMRELRKKAKNWEEYQSMRREAMDRLAEESRQRKRLLGTPLVGRAAIDFDVYHPGTFLQSLVTPPAFRVMVIEANHRVKHLNRLIGGMEGRFVLVAVAGNMVSFLEQSGKPIDIWSLQQVSADNVS